MFNDDLKYFSFGGLVALILIPTIYFLLAKLDGTITYFVVMLPILLFISILCGVYVFFKTTKLFNKTNKINTKLIRDTNQ